MIALVLGAALYLFALDKAVNPRPTVEAMGYVFGQTSAEALTRLLILGEIVLASACVAAVLLPVALLAMTALTSVFVVWTGYIWLVRPSVDCGCGTGILPFLPYDVADPWMPFVRALVFALLSGGGLLAAILSGRVRAAGGKVRGALA